MSLAYQSQNCTPYPYYEPHKLLISLKTAMFKIRSHQDRLIVMAAP